MRKCSDDKGLGEFSPDLDLKSSGGKGLESLEFSYALCLCPSLYRC